MQMAVMHTTTDACVRSPGVGERYFRSFYQSFQSAATHDDTFRARLQTAVIESEAHCRGHLGNLEQRECAVICHGFAGVLGRVCPSITRVTSLAVEEAEAAHRHVIIREYSTMQLQACIYEEMLERVNVEEFIEHQSRAAIEGREVPEWVSARQRYVSRVGNAAQEGSLAYQQQRHGEQQLQQLALIHTTETEERIDIERHQLLYRGAIADIYKRRLRDIIPRQAKYVRSQILLDTADSRSLVALESTQRLAVTFDERDEMRRMQAAEVLALFQLRSRS